jgi:hypothetical protein
MVRPQQKTTTKVYRATVVRHGRLLRAELILHGPYRAARQARAQASAQRGKTRPNIFTDEGQTDTSRSLLNQKDRLAAVSPKSDQVL